MPKTIDFNGKPMTLHVGNLPSHQQDMALTGTIDGLFGMKKEIMLITSLGPTTAEGKPIGAYCGYLDNYTKHYPAFRKALEDNGLITPVLDANGRPATKHLGGCDFPLVKFNREKLMEFDPKGCATYEQVSNRQRLINHTTEQVRARMDSMYGASPSDDGIGY